MKFMEITKNKWFLKVWAVLMFTFLLTTIMVPPAHAGCGWTDGPAEYQGVELMLGFAGAGAIVGLFFPPIGVAAIALGGFAAMYHATLMFSGC